MWVSSKRPMSDGLQMAEQRFRQGGDQDARVCTVVTMPRPKTYAEVVQVVEQHVDDVHRQVLRSTTDPVKGLPRFKKKAEQAQDERALDTLLKVLADVHPEVLTLDRLRSDSYTRIDGDALVAEDTRVRRRLQGIPEMAPSSLA